MSIQFEWDKANIDHIALHGVQCDDAEQVLTNNPLELQKSERGGEQRMAHLGETDAGRILVIASTVRKGHVRVITAYPAKRKLRALFYKQSEAE